MRKKNKKKNVRGGGTQDLNTYLRNKQTEVQTSTSFRGLIVPDKFYTHLVYNAQLTVISGSSTGGYIFRGNSCFDPDQTGVGHQPMGYDELMQLYTRYRVHSSRIKIVHQYLSAGACRVTCTPTVTTSFPASLTDALETPYTQLMIVPSIYSNPRALTNQMQTTKLFGIDSIDYQTDYAGEIGTNPTQEWYWLILANSFDLTSNVTEYCTINITYDVELFRRFELAQSLNLPKEKVYVAKPYLNGEHLKLVSKDDKPSLEEPTT